MMSVISRQDSNQHEYFGNLIAIKANGGTMFPRSLSLLYLPVE
jgi:hypothetical protein